MGKIGKKKTVLLALSLTAVALIIPFLKYDFTWVLIAFSLLGISNTILQVSLNPLIAAMFTKEKTASVLTTGQFVKSISSLLGPVLAGVAVTVFGDWKMAFTLFSVISVLSIVLLSFATTNEFAFNTSQTSFRSVMGLLKERNILFSFLSIMLIVGLDVGLNTIAPELLMKKVGLELSRAGLGSSVYFFAKIAGTLVGALMLLKTAPLRFLKISLLIAVIAFVPLMFMSELWVLVAAIFVIGFMCANVFSIIFSFALQNKAERSNEISALMIMGVSGGAVILPLQGYVNDIFGLTASISILMISLLCILLLTRKMTSHAQQ
jgi:fucose permease